MKMNPFAVATEITTRIEQEKTGEYKAVYEALEKLDLDNQVAAKNNYSFDAGPESMEYAVSNLLYSSHIAYVYPTPPIFKRSEALLVTKFLSQVPSGRAALMGIVSYLFPQIVICTEHLYFLQRQMIRLFELPDDERPEQLRGQKPCEWLFPQDEVERIRILAIDTWKAAEDKHNADETGN